jgi:hypothetical protein
MTDERIILDPGQGGMSIGSGALEIGDIIVSTSSGKASEIIRGATGSEISHAGIYVGDGLVVEAIGGGVQLTTLASALADDRYAVALRHPDLSEEQRLIIRDFVGQQIGQSYDFRAIALHGLYRLAGPVCDSLGGMDRVACNAARWQVAFGNDSSDRWYCSELIFSAFEAAGLPLTTQPAHTRTPQNLLDLHPPLEYVGHLKAEVASSQSMAWAQQQSLQDITHAGRYRLAYDRLTSYGVIEPLPGRNTRTFRGTAALQNALNDWANYIPDVMDPPPAYILTGGLTVNKPGQHGVGNAVDIDGFWWSSTDKFMANDAPTDWWRYLRYEATLRKAFGTVLNYDYNTDHQDHWHCDLGGTTAWRGVESQAKFVQRALNEIWGENLIIDGNWGNNSRAALTRAGYDFTTPDGWNNFLDDIIHQQSGSTFAILAQSHRAQPRSRQQWAAAIGGMPGRSVSHTLGGDENEVEVRFRIFIPAPVVDGPTGAFGGDGRGFSATGGSARADLHARIRLRQDGVPRVTIISRSWGESTTYESHDVIDVPGKPGWWKDKRNGAVPSERETLTATNDNLNLTVGGTTRDNVEVTASDATVVTFTADGGIPLMRLAPNISANLRLHLKREGGQLKAKLLGDHDGFPAYEVYVEGRRLYGYDPVSAGNSPTALFPPSDVSVSTGWRNMAGAASQALQGGALQAGAAAGGAVLKAAEMTIGLLAGADNNMDISWQVPQSSGRYHPRHDSWSEEQRRDFGSPSYRNHSRHTSASQRSIIGTQIWSKHELSFDYNGTYIANVSVSPPRELDDRLGWGLRIEGQITPHHRVFRKGSHRNMARVDVDLYWYFSVSILGVWNTVYVCHKEYHLYANGDVYMKVFWDGEETASLRRLIREATNPAPAASQGIRQVAPVQRSTIETSENLEHELLPQHIELTPADTEGRFVLLHGEGPEPSPTDDGPALVASLSSGRTLGGLPLLPARRGGVPAARGNLALKPDPDLASVPPESQSLGRHLELVPTPEQTLLIEEERDYEDPSQFPANLPEPGSGQDRFTLSIPQGMRFAHVDIEYLDRSTLADVNILSKPQRGAEGTQQIVLAWSHPPYGRLRYRVRAYASADGSSAPVRVEEAAVGADDRLKLLIEQDVPVQLVVKGNRARMLYEAIQRAQNQQPKSQQAEAITIVAGLAIVVVIAAVVMLGFMMLYAILTQALNKGYDIEDTRYKAAGGEGASKQEHELLFNLKK